MTNDGGGSLGSPLAFEIGELEELFDSDADEEAGLEPEEVSVAL